MVIVVLQRVRDFQAHKDMRLKMLLCFPHGESIIGNMITVLLHLAIPNRDMLPWEMHLPLSHTRFCTVFVNGVVIVFGPGEQASATAGE